jgi:hypothetical protein
VACGKRVFDGDFEHDPSVPDTHTGSGSASG